MSKYESLDEFEMESLVKDGSKTIVTAGIVSEIEHKSSKKGDYCRFRIEQNYSFVWVTVWSDSYKEYEQALTDCVGKIALIKAKGYYDNYKGENCLQSDNGFKLEFLF